MKTEQSRWKEGVGWEPGPPGRSLVGADLVLAFGSTELLRDARRTQELASAYPGASVVACSTAGEILGLEVTDDTVTATAVAFEHTRVQAREVHIGAGPSESASVGARLGKSLDPDGLRHVLVFSDGQHVNGSALVEGLTANLPAGVAVTGGLAGDGARFAHTLVGLGRPGEGNVIGVGLYGDRLRVGYGSMGGWDPFGPERLVTRSKGNVVYELDHQPALALYKKYIGDHAAGLPAAGLLFPLSLRSANGRELVRTILSVDEAAQSMTFAGDLPEGSYARLMKANFDRLVDGAQGAARASREAMAGSTPELALLISCVGRKLVLGQRTEDEVEAVCEMLGGGPAVTGFYSYGELCPSAPGAGCELHNQTMTITTLSER